jgi:hypothetical protein
LRWRSCRLTLWPTFRVSVQWVASIVVEVGWSDPATGRVFLSFVGRAGGHVRGEGR